MPFHEVRFPANLSFGYLGGQERRTDIVTLTNGSEERNTPWEHSRRRYDAGVGLRSLDDLEDLIAFFEARQGQLYGFRWKDWSDYRSSRASKTISYTDQVIGYGDGQAKQFQICKRYESGGEVYQRPIRKLVEGTVKAGFDNSELAFGTQWSVDYTSGIISFETPPFHGVVVSAGYEFDVPVRFDVDRIQTSMASFRAGDAPNIPVIEIRI